jgi:hypothetical protein
VVGDAVRSPYAAEPSGTSATREPAHRLRLLLVMAQGSAGAVPEAWRSYVHIGDARAGALEAPQNPQVLRVAIVEDDHKPLRLCTPAVASVSTRMLRNALTHCMTGRSRDV